MKHLFIPAKIKSEINPSKIQEISKKLPKNIAIAYSIQYKNLAEQIKSLLLKNHKVTSFIQVLGCSKPKFPKQTQTILLISDGKFHALSLASNLKIPVHLFNNSKLEKISESQIKDFGKRQKSSYVNFLNSKKAGILISIKSGQQNLKNALEIKGKLKDKEIYFFLSNNIDEKEFENFPEIQSWINTACPRLDMDSNKIINIDKLNLCNRENTF